MRQKLNAPERLRRTKAPGKEDWGRQTYVTNQQSREALAALVKLLDNTSSACLRWGCLLLQEVVTQLTKGSKIMVHTRHGAIKKLRLPWE